MKFYRTATQKRRKEREKMAIYGCVRVSSADQNEDNYYYNSAESNLELMGASRIGDGGYAYLLFSRASDYAIYIDNRNHAWVIPFNDETGQVRHFRRNDVLRRKGIPRLQ